MEFFQTILIAAIAASMPLLLATLGGILSERAGVINLGIEGMMLVGAVIAYIVSVTAVNLPLAIICSMLAASLLGFLLAFLSVSLQANQIVAGLGITLFATGLSSYLGRPFGGQHPEISIPALRIEWLDAVPVIGPLFANLNLLVWVSFLLAIGLHLLLHKTPWGLHLRAVGDSPATADAAGIKVYRYQYALVVMGAALCGLAGASLILVYTTSWNDGLTSGRGWIAVALVIFARWNPVRAIFCACLFGVFEALGFKIQLYSEAIPPYFLKMMPYLTTILVLMVVGWRNRNRPNGQPAALGIPYRREQRV